MEDDLVREVPDSLKQLVKKTINAFYTLDDTVIISILLVHPCLKEDDLCTLLHFNIKHLRARLAALKKDKLIKLKIVMKAGTEEDKPVQVNCYYIDYKNFVNVLKYKMDVMYKRLYNIKKNVLAGYQCSVCSKIYSEIQVTAIINYRTGAMTCSSCGGDVDAMQSNSSDISNLQKKFNEQFDPLVKLLKEVHNMTLAPEILEPQPIDIEVIRGSGNKEKWSGEGTRSSGTDHQTAIQIVFGEVTNESVQTISRDLPIWLTASTITDVNETHDAFIYAFYKFQNSTQYLRSSENSKMEIEDVCMDTNPNPQNNADSQTNQEDDDILSILLDNENRHQETRSGRSNMEVDIDNVENDPFNHNIAMDISENENISTITVGNRIFNFADINNEIIESMTNAEKDEYVRVFHIINQF